MSAQDDVNRNAVKALLEGRSDADVHEVCVKALRDWYATAQGRNEFQMNDGFGRALVRGLAAPKSLHEENEVQRWKEVFIDNQALSEPWMDSLLEFMSWFTLAGLGVVRGRTDSSWPVRVRLTKAGHRFCAGSDEHPFLPGFASRIKERCAGVSDGIVLLFEDARACLERGFNRPAVVLLGVAYEVATEDICESLVNALPQHLPQVADGAARRIADLRGVVATVIPGSGKPQIDDRFAVNRALNFADDLRRRRNDAAHTMPRYGFEDRTEIEELFVSAARQLPVLWLLHR